MDPHYLLISMRVLERRPQAKYSPCFAGVDHTMLERSESSKAVESSSGIFERSSVCLFNSSLRKDKVAEETEVSFFYSMHCA